VAALLVIGFGCGNHHATKKGFVTLGREEQERAITSALSRKEYAAVNALLMAHPSQCAALAKLRTRIPPTVWAKAPSTPGIGDDRDWMAFAEYVSGLDKESLPVDFYVAAFRKHDREPADALLAAAAFADTGAHHWEPKLLYRLYLRCVNGVLGDVPVGRQLHKTLLELAESGKKELVGVPIGDLIDLARKQTEMTERQ
jgi:hypothetical protein